jgi:hypothetical protein
MDKDSLKRDLLMKQAVKYNNKKRDLLKRLCRTTPDMEVLPKKKTKLNYQILQK